METYLATSCLTGGSRFSGLSTEYSVCYSVDRVKTDHVLIFGDLRYRSSSRLLAGAVNIVIDAFVFADVM
jgi:hypothetical protein